MKSEILKIRPEFKSVEDLIVRLQTYATALNSLDKQWSDIKNGASSDFDRIYSLDGKETRILEWFYNEGRQLAGDLRYNIEQWMAPERFATFKSFIDHLESNWAKYLPELNQKFEINKEKAEKIKNAPTAIVPLGILKFQEVLNIYEGIAVFVNIAKNTKLYKMEAGEYMEEKEASSQNITFNAPVSNIGNVTGQATDSQITAAQKQMANIATQKKEGKGIFSTIIRYIKKIILGN